MSNLQQTTEAAAARVIPLVSVVVARLDEEEHVARCVRGAIEALSQAHLDDDVIVADDASEGGEHIVMADADLTHDFGEVPNFVAKPLDGAQLVMGRGSGGPARRGPET